jgi:hypothetical protein
MDQDDITIEMTTDVGKEPTSEPTFKENKNGTLVAFSGGGIR